MRGRGRVREGGVMFIWGSMVVVVMVVSGRVVLSEGLVVAGDRGMVLVVRDREVVIWEWSPSVGRRRVLAEMLVARRALSAMLMYS